MWLYYNYLNRINISFDDMVAWTKQAKDYFSEDTGYDKYMNYEGTRSGRHFSINIQYKFGDFKENKIKRTSGSDNYNHGGGEMNYGY